MFSFFEKLTRAFPDQDNQTPPNKLLSFLLYYCEGFKIPLLIMMFAGIAISILEVSLFGFLGNIVDWLTQKNSETFLQEEKGTLIYMSIITVLIIPLLHFISSFTRHLLVMGNMPMAIRWRIHNYLLGQSLSFYQDEFSGRISAKVMQTALAIRHVANTTMDVMVYVAVYFVSIIALMYQQHWAMILMMIGWLAIYGMMLRYFLPRLGKASEQQADARSMMTGRITDAYTNIATVKLFAHTQREANYARWAMNEFLQTVYRQMRLGASLDVLLNLLNFFLIFAITAVGIALWLQDIMSVGGVAIATALALRLNGMSHWVMWEIGGLFEDIGTVADGMEMLARPIKVLDKPQASALNVEKGEISFENVSFAYHKDANKHVLNGLNLNIKKGEKIGLVGRSGAGKSTLVNALLRFYDIDSGRILIDGQNIAEVTQDSLRQNIAMVSQDTSLLHRSVRDNILYGRPEASEEALLQAIHRAEAFDFIQSLTDRKGRSGLDAQVGERGVKLSGGQRQRIAIARVLLKDAPILILDEATSALDSEVEHAIQASLMQLMEGKTVIAIAHRLSTIAQMDRLIVLDKGQIIEEGSHEALLAKGGLYAQLWARQTGGYLGE